MMPAIPTVPLPLVSQAYVQHRVIIYEIIPKPYCITTRKEHTWNKARNISDNITSWKSSVSSGTNTPLNVDNILDIRRMFDVCLSSLLFIATVSDGTFGSSVEGMTLGTNGIPKDVFTTEFRCSCSLSSQLNIS